MLVYVEGFVKLKVGERHEIEAF